MVPGVDWVAVAATKTKLHFGKERQLQSIQDEMEQRMMLGKKL